MLQSQNSNLHRVLLCTDGKVRCFGGFFWCYFYKERANIITFVIHLRVTIYVTEAEQTSQCVR